MVLFGVLPEWISHAYFTLSTVFPPRKLGTFDVLRLPLCRPSSSVAVLFSPFGLVVEREKILLRDHIQNREGKKVKAGAGN